MTKYSKQHYEDVAEILGKHDDPELISLAFIRLFIEDNPNFDSNLFLRRIGQELESRVQVKERADPWPTSFQARSD